MPLVSIKYLGLKKSKGYKDGSQKPHLTQGCEMLMASFPACVATYFLTTEPSGMAQGKPRVPNPTAH